MGPLAPSSRDSSPRLIPALSKTMLNYSPRGAESSRQTHDFKCRDSMEAQI